MKRYLKPFLLLSLAFVVGWTVLVDNFLGVPLTQATPTDGQIWKYSSATGKYVLSTDAGGPESLSISDLTDVGAMTEAQGDLLLFGTDWSRLPIGSADQFLVSNGTTPTYRIIASGDIDELLRLEELQDVATMTEARGDLLVRNASSAWDRLAVGGSGTLLHGGTDPSYSAVVSADVQDGTLVSADLSASAGITSAQILDGELLAGDFATATVNRLNPTPAAAGNIPVDAGAGSPYTSIDGSDADTTKALFATGASSAPAFRVLGATDIDELIRLEELSDVATMTEAAGDLLARNAGNTAWDRLDATDADTTKALFSTGASSVPAMRNLAQSDIDELLSISDLTDVGAMTEAEGDLLTVNGTNWDRLARGTANQVLATNSGGTDIAYISLAGDVSAASGLGALQVTDLTITSEATGDSLTFNGSNWVRLDLTDADTTKGLFSTGAASVPALRNLAAGDIDELLDIDQLANVATMTEAVGDILYVDSTGPVVWQRLAVGSNGDVLTLASGKPSWAAPASGSIAVAETDLTPNNTATTRVNFISSEFVLASAGGTVTVQLATNSVTSTTIAADSVDTSEIVAGAPGASGAELANTTSNLSGDGTLDPASDEWIIPAANFIRFTGGAGDDPPTSGGIGHDTTLKQHVTRSAWGKAGVPQVVFANTADIGSVTDQTAQTSFGTIYSIPDNAPAAGRVIHMSFGGDVSCGTNAAQAIEMDVQFGGITVADFGTDMLFATTNAAASVGWHADVWIVVRAGGDAGSVLSHGTLGVGREGTTNTDRGAYKRINCTSPTAIDFNGAATAITVRASFGNNTGSTDTITLRNVVITVH